MIEGVGIDATALLAPGVYILRQRGRVVFVGGARRPLDRLYAHANYRRGDTAPAWLPAKPIQFDSVEIRPCGVDRISVVVAEARAELGWTPPAPRTPTNWQAALAHA